MRRRDLLNERRFAAGQLCVLLGGVYGREHVPSSDAIGRCDVGRQVLTIDFAAEHEQPRRLE